MATLGVRGGLYRTAFSLKTGIYWPLLSKRWAEVYFTGVSGYLASVVMLWIDLLSRCWPNVDSVKTDSQPVRALTIYSVNPFAIPAYITVCDYNNNKVNSDHTDLHLASTSCEWNLFLERLWLHLPSFNLIQPYRTITSNKMSMSLSK